MSENNDPDWIKAEDAWRPALDAIFGRSKADLRPLADMLRGEIPISPGLRDTLAELLDPGEPALYDIKLAIQGTKPPSYKNGGALRWISVAKAFEQARSGGASYEEAQEIAAKAHNMSTRHVARIIEKADDFLKRLKGADPAQRQ